MARYIFVTGGVVSSLGKGIASASLAALLQARGYTVCLRKFDPYLNVDPGTMSPYQHGEVFVTEDGAETDLDLGHYERFTGLPGHRGDSITSGKIYSEVISRERRGDYLGATVQVIPHVTDLIKEFIRSGAEKYDFMICEIGGTVGDIESLPFLEAIRQMRNEEGHDGVLFVHLTLLPFIKSAGEFKTKPTQHSVKELLSLGIQADVLLCRCEHNIPEDVRQKISLFCNITKSSVIPAIDVATIYEVPLIYHSFGLDHVVLDHFDLSYDQKPDLSRWRTIVDRLKNPEDEVNIAIIGKYTHLKDCYKSLHEALIHGGIANKTRVNLDWIESEILEEMPDDEFERALSTAHGILVPGGFGQRGTEGKIRAIQYARAHKIPYFGICFGMQMAIVEAARHLAGLEGAGSTEFGPSAVPVVGLLTEWVRGNELEKRSETTDKGGTMRLGTYPAQLLPKSLIHKIYGQDVIHERHRHRYEVNINYRDKLEKAGVMFSGLSPDGELPEIIERSDHPWFIGVQFHPELKSRPFEPHPLFTAFVAAARKQKASNDVIPLRQRGMSEQEIPGKKRQKQ